MRGVISKFVQKTGLAVASVLILASSVLTGGILIAQPAGAMCPINDGSCAGTGSSPKPTTSACITKQPGMTKPPVGETFCATSGSKGGTVTCTKPKVLVSGKCVTPSGSGTVQTANSSALTCHHQTSTVLTDVIYNGLSGGSNVSSLIKSFQTFYDNNSDGHYADLKKTYNYGGASQSLVDSLDTSNTFLGYSKSDGTLHVIINGVDTVVGTNMQIAARWGESDTQNFTQIPGTGVCMHSYTRWFSNGRGTGPDVPTLVHIDQNTGTADFALWTLCGNMITFTHVAPKPVLQCVELDKELDKDFTYNFTATAYAKYITISNYYFDFGDGNSTEVTTSQTTAHTSHTYQQTGVQQTITITVYVNTAGHHGKVGVTGENCTKQIVIPPKGHLTFACEQLFATLKDKSSNHRTYQFEALTQGSDSAKNYTFYFVNADGSTVSIGAQASNASSHTYAIDASKIQNGKAYFVATSQTGLTTDRTDSNCQFQFTTSLVRTGPESTFGLFALSSMLGIGIHQLILRRKLA